MKNDSLGIISLEDLWVQRIVDIVAEDLELPTMDLEQREALERVIMMSISLYFVFVRESMNNTTKLNQ